MERNKTEYWACDKVRQFAPYSREYVTLFWIAWHADERGFGTIAKYETIARNSRQSVRTVRRHVRILVLRGDLVTWCDLQRRGSSNGFFIPMAAETLDELEKRTGISRSQMRLFPVEYDKEAGVLVAKSFLRPSPTATLDVGHGHDGPETLVSIKLTGEGTHKRSVGKGMVVKTKDPALRKVRPIGDVLDMRPGSPMPADVRQQFMRYEEKLRGLPRDWHEQEEENRRREKEQALAARKKALETVTPDSIAELKALGVDVTKIESYRAVLAGMAEEIEA